MSSNIRLLNLSYYRQHGMQLVRSQVCAGLKIQPSAYSMLDLVKQKKKLLLDTVVG